GKVRRSGRLEGAPFRARAILILRLSSPTLTRGGEWRRVTMRPTFAVVVLFRGFASPAGRPAHRRQNQPRPARPAGAVQAEKKPITKSLDFVGRVEAIDRVEVRARVTGYLEEVLFKEGDLVKEGAPLYRIEPGLFEAAVEQAQGALERSRGSRALTQIQLQRAQDLMDKQAGTVVARDQAKDADDQARA